MYHPYLRKRSRFKPIPFLRLQRSLIAQILSDMFNHRLELKSELQIFSRRQVITL